MNLSTLLAHPFLAIILVILVIAFALLAVRFVQLSPRRQWRLRFCIHEIGHALVAWFGCPTAVGVVQINRTGDGFECRYVHQSSGLSATELWHRLAFHLAGMAAEISASGRLRTPRGCQADLSEALNDARTLIELRTPEIDRIRREIGTVVNPPNWTRINQHPRLTADETEVLKLGFRLAVTIIVRHRAAFHRAQALALPRYDRHMILTRDELAECFDGPATHA